MIGGSSDTFALVGSSPSIRERHAQGEVAPRYLDIFLFLGLAMGSIADGSATHGQNCDRIAWRLTSKRLTKHALPERVVGAIFDGIDFGTYIK